MDVFKVNDINKGVEEYRKTDGAILIDVREPEEFKQGSIKGAVNIPLGKIGSIGGFVDDKDKPIFVYCRSGARASKAVSGLKKMGYTSVKNIGGITDYKGL